MSVEAYKTLVDILRSNLTLNIKQSSCRTNSGYILTEMIVCVGIRFMGREYIKSLADIYGMSILSVKILVNLFLKSIDTSRNHLLSTNLLTSTPMSRAKAARDWEILIGGSGVMFRHIVPIDGWLYTTWCPYGVANPSDYFSGHYQTRELNVQAMGDANLRIIYISVVGPGKMNDARA